jgi:hypothetical protein
MLLEIKQHRMEINPAGQPKEKNMTDKINGITERLIAQADEELKLSLHKKFYAIRNEFTDGCSKVITVTGGYVQGQDNGSKKHIVDAHAALQGLEELSFQVQCEKYRQTKIDDFMSRVETLATEVDELRQSIPQ